MQPYSLIIEDFLDDDSFKELRLLGDNGEFVNRENPHDGITYPEILEFEDKYNIERKLSMVLGSQAQIRLLVMRRSSEGVNTPEQAHDDTEVYGSQYTMILYMNRLAHCKGGTTLLEHIPSRTQFGPQNKIWQKDKNNASKWRTVLPVQMVQNRAFIFPSGLIHRSDPIGGFGTKPFDSRLVIACLFDLVARGN